MALDGGNGNMIMPVAPSGGFGGNGFGGDGGWWILLLFILLGGWNNGGNAYGAGGGGLYPWLNQSEQINDGFRDQMLNTTVNGIQQSITAGFGNVQNGFAQAEISANARQMADMNQTFGFQTSMLQGFNSLQGQLAQCCCDNRLATCQTQNLVQSEGAATRLAIQNQTQQILDKMCQQEIDALKRENENLRTMVNMQNLAASQTAQTAQLIADNTAQTQYIVNRVAPYPIPAYTVANPVTPAAATNG